MPFHSGHLLFYMAEIVLGSSGFGKFESNYELLRGEIFVERILGTNLQILFFSNYCLFLYLKLSILSY
jgi:hypothetical protein